MLTFKQDGVALSAELVANGSINAKVNKLGDTVFEIAVEAEGMKKSASKKLTMVLPVYMGFAGASDAAGLAITELSKYAPLSSPAGTYKIKNNADGIYLWLCVPDTMTINKVTSSGFTVPMRRCRPDRPSWEATSATVQATPSWQVNIHTQYHKRLWTQRIR